MEKNNLIGITIIFLLFFILIKYNAPSETEMAAMKAEQDSIAMVQAHADSIARLDPIDAQLSAPNVDPIIADSLQAIQRSREFGSFADQTVGEEKTSVLENELFKITFSNRGGRIKKVHLKKYHKLRLTEEKEEIREDLFLMEDEKNKFEYLLPDAGTVAGMVSTSDMIFTPTLTGNTLKFSVRTDKGQLFEQTYTIAPNSYNVDYQVNAQGLGGASSIALNWVNYLDRIERNTNYERNYSSVYFKETDDSPDYCSCTGDDEEISDAKVKWVSHVHQFFNSSLIANDYFGKSIVTTEMLPEEGPDLKKITSRIDIPVTGQPVNMKFYIGPNEFDRLAAYDLELEDVIPYGRSIFGTVNRWIIRPMFNFLSGFIGSKGLVILALTFIIKVVLYPLTYKMLYSQSKMQVLKPRIAKAKEKVGDDPQKQQMETMKMYREYGVNPMGGCFPVFLQMPIWIALYRFFPASIEFRQASFLWATDLSSYDVFAYLPFDIPFYGSHVSMFTILWAVTTVIYTWYNSKHMDMGAMNNPMMKYMQYMMPVMFLFFFNSFASGLSCYLFFSNILNIGQNVVTKEVIIDKKKIENELNNYQKKPKKKGGFQERLSKVLEEQRKIQEQQSKKKK